MTVTRPWDYAQMVADLARDVDALLDMGTGGGEFLLEMTARPPRTVATEGWPPNVALAAANLRPIGVPVVQDEGAADNVLQSLQDPRGRLPFRRGAFGLVVNRHEAFTATEVARILPPGGIFLTQQVDNGNLDDAYALLSVDVESPPSWLDVAVDQLHDAGFTVDDAECGDETYTFADAGAFAWYLKAVTPLHHDYPAFSIAAHRSTLLRLATPIVTTQKRFYIRAHT